MNTALTFAHPAILWALAILPVLVAVFLTAEQSRKIALGKLIAARLQPRLAGTVSVARRRWGFVLLLLGLALCILALARPRWGVTMEEQTSRGRDVIFAIDTSRSMLAQDVPPNRLERCKLASLDLMGELAGDRVGLIAFAGEAFLQCPLTPDQDAVSETIQSLDTEAIGQGGSNLAAALLAAKEAFGKGESTQRALVLFSDGEELQDDVLDAAASCKEVFRIYTIGVGTEGGAPVIRPTNYGGEYVRDPQGNIVSSKLDESRLRKVAEITGGFYLHLQNGPADMRRLAQQGLETMSQKDSETRTREVPKERFQWPLVAGLVCLTTAILLGERRRVLPRIAAAAALLFLSTLPAGAETTAEQLRGRMNRMFDSSKPDLDAPDLSSEMKNLQEQKTRRPNVPEIDYNLGCTAYTKGDYDEAVSSFSNALGGANPELNVKATYNLANSLARRGVKREKDAKLSDWNNAVKQYDTVLSVDPNHAKARENRDAVLKAIEALKEQEKKEDQQKKQDQKDQKDQQQKDDKNQQKQDQQKSQGGDKSDSAKNSSKENKDQGNQGQDTSGDQDQQQKQQQQQGKSGEQKNGADQQQKQPKTGNEPKPEDAKQGEPKPGEEQDQQQGKQGDQKEKQEAKPKASDLKPAGQPQDKKDGQGGQAGEPGSDKDQEAAEAAQAAKEGRMTEKDARALIDSARKYERVVPPLQQWMDRRVQRPANGKDW